MSTTAMVPGSLQALAQADGKSLAETFVHCDCVVLVDTSGSMGNRDARDNRRRYDVALEELGNLQRQSPGKFGVIGFSSHATFYPGGVPKYEADSTDLARALQLARLADVSDMRFVLISDGHPDDAQAALAEARKFRNRIDVIYIGPEGGAGQEFLNKLAALTGGQHVRVETVTLALEAGVRALLSGQRSV